MGLFCIIDFVKVISGLFAGLFLSENHITAFHIDTIYTIDTWFIC